MAVIILAVILTIITGAHYFGRNLARPVWLVLFHSFGGSAALAVSSLSQLDLNGKSNVRFSESVARAAFSFH